MAAQRLSALQKAVLRWLLAEDERLRGTMAASHADLVRAMAALRQHAPGAVTAADLNPVQRKAALVARLRALKAQGLSLQAIANQLNLEQVPTLSGTGHWQKGTVGNLLAEAAPVPR